jgi:hypothetical protein
MPASVCSDLSAPFGQGTYVCGFRVGNMPPHYPGFTIEAHRDHALGGLAARHRAPNRTLPLGSRNGEVGAPSYRRAQVRTGQWGSSLPLVSRPISIATTLNSAKQTMIAAATLKPPSATASKPAISGPKLVITLRLKNNQRISKPRRKLAAIFAADVAGYSRLMARDA